MTGYTEARFLRYSVFNRFVHRLIQIKNAAAFITSEVVMVLGITVETARGATIIKLQDFPRFAQQPQVAVNRPKTYIGDLLPHLLINPISAWVRGCAP